MQINVLYLSLFQVNCSRRGSESADGGTKVSARKASSSGAKATSSNDRVYSSQAARFCGRILVPFFPNQTTLAELYQGIEYRLNRYVRAHDPVDQRPHGELKKTMASVLPHEQSVYGPASYYCPCCCTVDEVEGSMSPAPIGVKGELVVESDVSLSTEEYPPSGVTHVINVFPVVSVVAILQGIAGSDSRSEEKALVDEWAATGRGLERLRREFDDAQRKRRKAEPSVAVDDDALVKSLLASGYIPAPQPFSDDSCMFLSRDAHNTLPDDARHLCVMFESRMMIAKSNCPLIHDDVDNLLVPQTTSISAGRSELCECIVEKQPIVTDDGMTHRLEFGSNHTPIFLSERVPVRVSLFVNGSLFRMAFSSFHTCRDLIIRTESMFGIRLARVYDGATGAAILPCECLVHVVWKLSGQLEGEADTTQSLVAPLRGILMAKESAIQSTPPAFPRGSTAFQEGSPVCYDVDEEDFDVITSYREALLESGLNPTQQRQRGVVPGEELLLHSQETVRRFSPKQRRSKRMRTDDSDNWDDVLADDAEDLYASRLHEDIVGNATQPNPREDSISDSKTWVLEEQGRPTVPQVPLWRSHDVDELSIHASDTSSAVGHDDENGGDSCMPEENNNEPRPRGDSTIGVRHRADRVSSLEWSDDEDETFGHRIGASTESGAAVVAVTQRIEYAHCQPRGSRNMDDTFLFDEDALRDDESDDVFDEG